MYLQYYLLAYIAGALISFKLIPESFEWFALCSVLLLTIAIQFLRKRKKSIPLLILLFSFCVGGNNILVCTNVNTPITYQSGNTTLTLVEKTNKKNIFVAKFNSTIFEKTHLILADLQSEKSNEFQIGDELFCNGYFLPLNTRKSHLLYGSKFILKSLYYRKQSPLDFQSFANRTQSFLSSNLEKIESDSASRSIIQAMIWGDTSTLSKDMKEQFKASGTYHLLAVSGMQISIIISILTWIKTRITKKNKKSKYIIVGIIITTILFFAAVAGGSASVWRATIMGVISLISLSMNFQSSKYHSLTIAIFISVLFFPEFIFNLGFILSITAIFGIYFIHPKIQQWIKTKNTLLNWLIEILSISLSTQLALLPILWYTFGTFPTYFLLANLVLVPLSSILIFLVLIGMTAYSIPLINESTSFLTHHLSQWIIETNHFISKLPYSCIELPEISLSQAAILGIIVLSFFFPFQKKINITIQICVAVILLIELNGSVTNKNRNHVCYHGHYNNETITIKNDVCTAIIGDSSTNRKLPIEIQFNSKKIQIIQEQNEIKENYDVYVFSKKSSKRIFNSNEIAKIKNSEYLFCRSISKKKKDWIKSKLDISNCENLLNYSSNAYL